MHAHRHRPGLPPRGLPPERLSRFRATDLTFRLSPDATRRRLPSSSIERREGVAAERAADPRRRRAGAAARRDRRRAARPSDYQATPDQLIILAPPAPARFELTIETEIDAGGQHGADGPLPLERHLLHAVRGRGLPPHHLFPRPARRAVGLHGAHRGATGRGAAAAVQRQSGRARAMLGDGRHFAVWHDPLPEAVLSVRAGGRRSRRRSTTASSPCPAARSSSASMSSTARSRAPPTPWTR